MKREKTEREFLHSLQEWIAWTTAYEFADLKRTWTQKELEFEETFRQTQSRTLEEAGRPRYQTERLEKLRLVMNPFRELN